MDEPSKEENNNHCSNQDIDAVVNNNIQEEISLLVTLCYVAYMYHACRLLRPACLCAYYMLTAETVQRPIWFSFGIPYEFLMERSCAEH